MQKPSKTLEKKLLANGYNAVIGVDEVGMGCLAGPVVVCAVAFKTEFYKSPHPEFRGVRDSKLLSAGQRERFAGELNNVPGMMFNISSCGPAVIDKINIYQASRKAMKRAIRRLISSFKFQGERDNKLTTKNPKRATIILVDGNKEIEGLPYDQTSIVKGDRKIFAIACASIIAKVHRDRMMVRYGKKYPGYGLEIHKGYGTKLHRQKIKELGMSTCHRKSFGVK